MDLQLTGKRALITGASRGIGLATAHALAAEGVDVALAARDEHTLEQAASAVRAHGQRVLAVATDTNDDTRVRSCVAAVVAEFGGIDILVNAAAEPAAPGPMPKLGEVTDDAVRREIETKVLGYLRCARAVAPIMAEQRWGRIVNISGLAARQSRSVVGSMRNVAVAAMTKNLADELGPAGINVTVVHPGLTVTERMPELLARLAADAGITVAELSARLDASTVIGRLVTAAEVADVVTFLASPRSVSITGDAVATGGGVPGSIYY